MRDCHYIFFEVRQIDMLKTHANPGMYIMTHSLVRLLEYYQLTSLGNFEAAK